MLRLMLRSWRILHYRLRVCVIFSGNMLSDWAFPFSLTRFSGRSFLAVGFIPPADMTMGVCRFFPDLREILTHTHR